MFDIQTYTNITLNEPITLSTPTHVRGKDSGAVDFSDTMYLLELL